MADLRAEQDLLDQLVHEIVEAVQPEKVILFGSRAKGTAETDSDIDLFVQLEAGRDTHEASREAYRVLGRLRNRPPVGVDIVVKDRAFVERYGELVGTIVRPVLREGKVLYAR